MYIQGVGTATPPHTYTQKECWDAFCRSPYLRELSGRSQAILRKILTGDCGIDRRHFAMPDLDEAFSVDPNTLHRRFSENAPALAARAARNALEQAEVSAAEIDGLIISTCTGYLCPGLTSYVSELLGLPPRIYLSDMVGHGCGAALPNLKTARALIHSGEARRVLSICVEICSAAFYVDNDPGVLVSACLFGDGAAAAVLGDRPGARLRSIKWSESSSLLNTRDRDLLRFESRNGMLRNVLDKSVPLLVVEQLREVLSDLLARAGESREAISEWIVHSGGKDVLAAIQTGLSVPAEKLLWSSQVLRENGNISSPCVLFALDKALQGSAAGGKWLLASFGAGITCHGALLEVQ
jgi:alkylresorcinol/alkylpyrone synthase